MSPLRYLTLMALAAPALAAEPRIDRVEPQGVRRGEEAVVKLFGPRLGAEPQELVLYEPGVEVGKIEVVDGNTITASIRLAEDCPLGRHAIRVRTASGLSNLVTLHVGALSSVSEEEPNDALDAAQAVPLNRTVHGHVRPEDVDTFAVDLSAGQRMSVEIEGLRLGRTFFDPVIEVLSESGEILASNDDQTPAHSDAFLTLRSEKERRVFVRVRESAYRGDGRSTYLLHIGDFPRPAGAHPVAAARGGETRVGWIGGDGGEQTIAVPADAGDAHHAHAEDEGGVCPTPLQLFVASEPPTLEVEPNNERGKATEMPGPGVGAGVIGAPGDVDYFRFPATTKATYGIRVRARELRTPLDAVLRIFDVDGKHLAGNDDDRGRPDSYLRFVAPADGDYVLQVSDRLERGGTDYAYALDVARPRPVAEIKLNERRRYEATVLEVPQGGRTAALFTATRRDFGGDLDLKFDDLPAGVAAECFPLAANYNLVPVVFTASADADLAASLSPVTASIVGADSPPPVETRFRQQTWLVRGRNNVPVWSHFANRAPIAVTQRLPFSISLDQPKAPLCRNGSLRLRVTAERDEGFANRIGVKMLYHSPGTSSNRSLAIAEGKTEVAIPITANGKARTGDWPIVVVGETNIDGRVYTSTQFVTLSVADAYFDVVVPAITSRQDESAEMVVSLSHRTPFEGVAKLELVGLPPGVTAQPVEASADDESAAFQLVIAPDAKPGRHRGVGCRVRIEVDGETVTYRHGYSDLNIDPSAPAAEQTTRRGSTGEGES